MGLVHLAPTDAGAPGYVLSAGSGGSQQQNVVRDGCTYTISSWVEDALQPFLETPDLNFKTEETTANKAATLTDFARMVCIAY